MLSHRCYHSATMAGGAVYAIGGTADATLIEKFDPATNVFSSVTTTGSTLPSISQHTATLLQDGVTLLIAGGTAGGAQSALYTLNTTTSVLTLLVPTLSTTRAAHTATLLPSGLVLLVDGNNPAASADLFNPAGPAVTATAGSPATARQGHSATLPGNGTVLIAGGQNTGGLLGSSEIFDRRAARRWLLGRGNADHGALAPHRDPVAQRQGVAGRRDGLCSRHRRTGQHHRPGHGPSRDPGQHQLGFRSRPAQLLGRGPGGVGTTGTVGSAETFLLP